MAMEPEAAAALQEIKNEAASARTTETNKTKLWITLLKLKAQALQEEQDREVKMAAEYMDLQKNAVDARTRLASTILSSKTSRSNAALAAAAADIRSIRSAAAKVAPGASLFKSDIDPSDLPSIQIVNNTPTEDQQRMALATHMLRKYVPGDPGQKGELAHARARWPDFSLTEALDADKIAHPDALKALNGTTTTDEDVAAAKLATDGSLDKVLAGTATDADYAEAWRVVDGTINKINLSEDKFKLSSDAELLAREKGPEGKEYETIVGELQRQIDKLEEDVFGEGIKQAEPEPTDEEEQARLIASPEFREWATDHGFKIGYAEQAVNEDGTPKFDANGNAMADMDTYEPGPDDKDAIHYAVQTVHGNAPTGPNKRESVAGLTSIKLAVDPDSYEAGQEAKNLMWSDGKYHKATNVDTGESHYMPPAMGDVVKSAEPLKYVALSEEGKSYIISPDGKVFYQDTNGKVTDITQILKDNPTAKANFDKDIAEIKPMDMYKKGANGTVPTTIDDVSAIYDSTLEVSPDPKKYGELEKGKNELPSNIQMEISDEAPTKSDSIWVNRAPRDLKTDAGSKPRTAHAADGKVLFQYDPRKTVRGADGEIYLYDIEKKAYHARSSLDTETLAEDKFSGRGVKPANMTAEEWAAEQSRLPAEERLDKQGVRPEVKGTAEELKAADEAAIEAQDAKQGEMVNVPTIGGGKRKPVPSDITEKGKKKLDAYYAALDRLSQEDLYLKDPITKAKEKELMEKDATIDIAPPKTPRRVPTPDPEAVKLSNDERYAEHVKRNAREAEQIKLEQFKERIPDLQAARDARQRALQLAAFKAKAASFDAELTPEEGTDLKGKTVEEWRAEQGDKAAAAAVEAEKETPKLRTGPLSIPANQIGSPKPQRGSTPGGPSQWGIGFTSPEIRGAKQPITTPEQTKSAEAAAAKWANPSTGDSRLIPKAAKEISATTGVNREVVKKVLIQARKAQKEAQPTTAGYNEAVKARKNNTSEK